MGSACSSQGALLLQAAANGDLSEARELLRRHPSTATYVNFKDRSSPLIQAAARGHFELLSLIVETAVMREGPDRAKRNCIDHVNSKKQSALMVACKHGHPDAVEYLVAAGSDPLMADARRHNSCLHFAALYGHTECVHKLLGTRASFHQGRSMNVSQILCHDEDGTVCRFVDRHNGWGLSALHIAVFQGSVTTVRALLRHGARLDSVIATASVENSPVRCAAGSNALHIAALIGNIQVAKVVLEAQESVPGLDLRNKADATGLKPREYAQRARNPVLYHLLDERLPVPLLRQMWGVHGDQSMPPRQQTLGSMLQKLKLLLNLELIALQRNLATAPGAEQHDPAPKPRGHSNSRLPVPVGDAQQRTLWAKRSGEVQGLLVTVTRLHGTLLDVSSKAAQGAQWPPGTTNGSQDAMLEFILSSLITPRTVSAIVHAAKRLVCSNCAQMAAASPAGNPAPMPAEADVQHGIALLNTALKAVETCLEAAAYLSDPLSTDQAGRASLLSGHSPEAVQQQPAPGSASAAPHAAEPSAADLVAAHSAGSQPLFAAGGAALDAAQTPPSSASHWSSNLHSVIAQLHWDIGVQRHRRRRQHMAQQAARASAAAAAAASVSDAPPVRPAVTVTAVSVSVSRRGKDSKSAGRGTAQGGGGAPGQGDAPQGDAEGDQSADESSGGEEAEEVGSVYSDDGVSCMICMDQPVAVQVTGCQHGLCVNCAYQLTIKGKELPSCPFCRQKIPAFEAKPDTTQS